MILFLFICKVQQGIYRWDQSEGLAHKRDQAKNKLNRKKLKWEAENSEMQFCFVFVLYFRVCVCGIDRFLTIMANNLLKFQPLSSCCTSAGVWNPLALQVQLDSNSHQPLSALAMIRDGGNCSLPKSGGSHRTHFCAGGSEVKGKSILPVQPCDKGLGRRVAMCPTSQRMVLSLKGHQKI